MIRWLNVGLSLFASSFLSAMEPLPDSFIVHFGEESAPRTVVEYVSVGCSSCHYFFQNEFPEIQKAFVSNGKASWSFHLVPDDLLSCQLAIAIDALGLRHDLKRELLSAVMDQYDGTNDLEVQGLMRRTLQSSGVDASFIGDPSLLRGNPKVQAIISYLSQEDAVRAVPTIEIDGKIYEEIPHLNFVREKIQ